MKLKPEQRVDLPTARTRALKYLAECHRTELAAANCIALVIWPDHQMTSQGAGAAASRVLKTLAKDGLVEWTSNDYNWGWRSTPKGRAQA